MKNHNLKKAGWIADNLNALIIKLKYVFPGDKNSDYFLISGNRILEKGMIVSALSYFNIALKMDSDNPKLYYQIALALSALNKFDAALEMCTIALDLNPDYEDVLFIRSQFYMKKDLNEKALSDVDKLIKLDKDNAEFYYMRASIKTALDKDKDSIKDFNRAIEIDPVFAKAYYSRGLSNLSIGDNFFAIKDFSKSIDLDTTNFEAYYFRGLAKYSFKDKKGAKEDWIIAEKAGNTNAYEALVKYFK